ncbi:MAG: superfamily protein [Xanthomonadaceae bacterium]|nr:superfamily protein [Xanthomonadaceae bacterium]
MPMSSADTGPPDGQAAAPLPATPGEAAHVVKQEGRLGAAFLRVHGWRLLLVFVGLLLPLWGFGAMADALHDGEVFVFDVPILEAIHSMASPQLDSAFIVMSALGYGWGVVPLDVLLVLGLVLRRRMREGIFAATSIVGSLLLNVAAKHSFERIRPGLWKSVSPAETTYSFPSGHAMGSMTLAMVVVLLCWSVRTRGGWSWRWPVSILAAVFVLLVGLSRIYLGVHFPSDILAGWTAACAWVVGVYGLVFYGTLKPWQVADKHAA